ncbi:MAG: glycoside hydrolase family 28 protein, partial [Bacteroidaceae bacterium]|nr:glycoside hydrolase family 28 protein [Bacteroidaceae bacterium]
DVVISDAKQGIVVSQAEGVTFENVRIETEGDQLNVKNAKGLSVNGETYEEIGFEAKKIAL